MIERRQAERRLKRRIQFWIFLACGAVIFTSFGYYLAAITQ